MVDPQHTYPLYPHAGRRRHIMPVRRQPVQGAIGQAIESSSGRCVVCVKWIWDILSECKCG